ncbi:MAG: hypothetical protein WAM28_01770, partial [Chlamydiales bacterium]
MKRTIALRLNVSAVEGNAFCQLQEVFAKACNQVARIAFQKKEKNRVRLHHLSYFLLRKAFPELGAQ